MITIDLSAIHKKMVSLKGRASDRSCSLRVACLLTALLGLVPLCGLPLLRAQSQFTTQPSDLTQSITLDLNKTIAMACDSSLSALSARNTFLSNYWAFRSYKAARLPSLSLSMVPLRYERAFTNRYDSETNRDEFRLQQSLYSSGNVGMQQNIDATGGTLYMDSELGYARTFGNTAYQQFSAVPVRLGYSQQLIGYNSFKWEKRIEPLKYEKAKRLLLYTMENIAESAAGYFFSLAMAQVDYDLAKMTLASSDTLYHMGIQRQAIASISQADLLTLKLDWINAENTLRNAEISLKKARFALANFLNMEQQAEIKLTIPDRPTMMVISADQALALVRTNNPDYLANRQAILEAEQVVERTSRTSRFEASLDMSVGFNQAAGSIMDSYKNPLDQEVVSVRLNVPLLDWGVRKGKVNMAKNQLSVTELGVKQDELSLEEEIIMIVSDFNVQQDLIKSAEEARSLADLAYEATKQRYLIGKADINSLTLALSRQESANRNFVSALRNYWLSFLKIRKMTLYDFEQRSPLIDQFESRYGIR